MESISAIELKQRISNNDSLIMIDVRDNIEFHSFNIGGIHVPLGKLENYIEDCDLDKQDEIVVICQRGLRSKTAAVILLNKGFMNVRNLSGGLLALRKASMN
ncbi:rhodanese-like domain-containing protein [Solitalea koreensis]|uniref:Rhodanese-related sulfurtransferase n=1 Tax=Solitalea koreensis TaxID=543615 RepID=A0A521EJK6_9SPHI|nr:rhodanese-like domain-containing protein [Solitalea koreensis]SMO84084.1 Rhodanese-related sulfurtransferase [Solitalea koreensis]